MEFVWSLVREGMERCCGEVAGRAPIGGEKEDGVALWLKVDGND
jgi:hypothetical protein